MEQLPHGQTNRTLGDGEVVHKTYTGPDAGQRLGRELAALSRMRDQVPLPRVLGVRGHTLQMGFVHGEHGQDLVARGAVEAAAVLRACGTVLRAIHTSRGNGQVLVHGDFGPNNLLFAGDTVVAVLDWEFAHLGQPVEDIAWCEWLVRTHHPGRTGALGEFFAAYGEIPPWRMRHEVMVKRCHELAEFSARAEPAGPGVDLWHERALTTAAWPATEIASTTGTT